MEWLNVFAVDNVLQRIADPCFVGATIATDSAVGAKVVAKNAPDEKVGAMCLEDGRPSIVEYYDMTPELMAAKNAQGGPAYHFGVILSVPGEGSGRDCGEKIAASYRGKENPLSE